MHIYANITIEREREREREREMYVNCEERAHLEILKWPGNNNK